MRLLRLVLLLSAASIAWPASTLANELEPGPLGPSERVGVFYYPWFGTAKHDGRYSHWQQGGSQPPVDVALELLPGARRLLVGRRARRRRPDARDRRRRHRGRDQLLVGAGLGRGSAPGAAAAAQRGGTASPSPPTSSRTEAGRSPRPRPTSLYLRGRGISDVYVWASPLLPDAEWAEMNRRVEGVRVFANTNLAGRAAAGGFDGLYTYDVLLFDGALFPRLCHQARRLQLLCAPSVGPGYDATPGDRRPSRQATAGRGDATTACGAARSARGADLVTITSYNEWHEGTQIEPARRGPAAGTSRTRAPGACRAGRRRPRTSTARRSGCSASRRRR